MESVDRLTRIFTQLGINASEPGFYDMPNFLAYERRDPSFLNAYAAFVKQQNYAPEYLARVRRIVPIVARIFHAELIAEGRLGACVDLSMAVSRVLERLGIWNYMVKGAVTARFSAESGLRTRYFWPLDEPPITGHVWIGAPPFTIIDLTIRQQPYEPEFLPYLPEMVVTEAVEPVCEPTVDDICSPLFQRVHGGGAAAHLRAAPHLPAVARLFPGVVISSAGALLSYFTCGFSASNEPLEKIQNQRWNGRFSSEILHDLIIPEIKSIGEYRGEH